MGDLKKYSENKLIVGRKYIHKEKPWVHGFVYAIRLNDKEVKIGKTDVPENRIKSVLSQIKGESYEKRYPMRRGYRDRKEGDPQNVEDATPTITIIEPCEVWFWNTPITKEIEDSVKRVCGRFRPYQDGNLHTEIFEVEWNKFLNIVRDVVLMEYLKFKYIRQDPVLQHTLESLFAQPFPGINMGDISDAEYEVFKLKL